MPPPHHYSEHGGRIAQMTKQEAVIANKQLELLEKKKNHDLARQVVAAQVGGNAESAQQMSNSPLELIEAATLTRKPAKNHFFNDGSFFENYKRITEAAAKKAQDEKEQRDREELEAKRARGDQEERTGSGDDDAGERAEGSDSDAASASEEEDEGDEANGTNDADRMNNLPPPMHQRRHPPPQSHHISHHSHQPPQQFPPPNYGSNLPPPPRPPIGLMPPPLYPPFAQHLQMPPHMMPFNQAPPMQHFSSGIPPPFMQFNLPVSAVPPPPPPPIESDTTKPPPDTDEGAHFNQNKRDHFIDDSNFITNDRSFDGRPQQVQQQQPQQQPSASSATLQSIKQQHGTDTNAFNIQSPAVTTVDALIDCVAANGDFYEDKVRSEHHDIMRSPFWFLNDKSSLQYGSYRQAVEQRRSQHEAAATVVDIDRASDDKYDPADILLNEDEEDANRPGSSAPTAGPKDLYDPSEQHSDDYDSDSEYHQETKERNFANIQKRLSEVDAPPNKRSLIGNQYDSSDEEEHMEMYKRIQMQEGGGHSNSNDSSSQSLQRSEGSRPYFEMSAGQDGGSGSNALMANMDGDALGDNELSRKRKRSRWGEKVPETKSPAQPLPLPLMSLNIPAMPGRSGAMASNFGNQKPILSAVTRHDPALLNYARDNFGTVHLSEEDWKKCEDHFKINLLYQDMLHKRNEIDRMAKSGKFKYEYDSDEDVSGGGTWEHKLRNAEMEATRMWADALTTKSAGKHHIGDFLPPEELKKFMEQYDSKKMNREPDLSDYKEFKLREDNKGFQMLQKLGWKEGQGLGFDGGGIKDPINKAQQRDSNQGLGATSSAVPESGDNEYDAYRKRMMLAYRFRPNPLNNPRRAYY